MLVVLTTTRSVEEAESLARKIIEAKLGACVQVLPPVTSFYFWEGAIQKEAEHLLLVKTLTAKFDELEKFMRANHSYETPEIFALKAEDVSENYLGWIKNYLE